MGFLVGMTGMGGGALMTPFLIIFLKMNPIMAVGTDLVFAAITKIGGGVQHYYQKTLKLKPILWMALGSLPASFISARFLISHVESERTRKLFPILLGAVLVGVGIIGLLRAGGWLTKKQGVPPVWPKPWSLIVIGAIGGGLVGLTSIGGGTVIMALLIVFFSIPPDYLVGLDVSHGALLALFTASAYAFSGHVDWLMVVWLLLGSLPGVWLGAKAVKKIPQRLVQVLLGLILLLAGINLLVG